jgi:hypothetical protein
LSIDNHERQRGSDEPDAPLLLEGDGAADEGNVVIGGEERNQGDHGASGGFQQSLAIKAEWDGERRWEQRLGRIGQWL